MRGNGRAHAAALALAGYMIAGCAVRSPYDDPAPRQVAEPAVTVRVDNSNLADVRIYVLRGATRIPLGAVGGFSSRTFRVSPVISSGMGELRLVADVLSSRETLDTAPVNVRPGSVVEWRLEQRLQRSSIAVR